MLDLEAMKYYLSKLRCRLYRLHHWILTIPVCLLPLKVEAQENVLLIIADDLGADSLGLYSSASTAPTPNIDSLSANGVRFTKAWASPTCSPTRAGLLTGRHAFRTGVGMGGDQIPLTEFTTAQALSDAGYATACIGKWHLGGATNGGDSNPNLMGFGHYEGAIAGTIGNYYNWTKVTNGVSSNVTTYGTTENVNNAITWINAQGGSPWYCQLAFNAPHPPYHKPPNNLHSYDSLSGTASDINNNPVPYYQAAIEAMDTEVGRLLNSIPAAVLQNTNIIFIGDNGTPRKVSPGVVRDWKGSLYEGGVHIPFIVSGPAIVSPGRANASRVQTVDIFATVLELADLDVASVVPNGIDYDSLSVEGYLASPTQTDYHTYSFTQRFTSPVNAKDGQSMRNNDYKLIRFDSTGAEEFYHLTTDPTESTNLLLSGLNAAEQIAYDELSAGVDALLNGSGGTVTIDSENFESGWGIWNNGGSDSRRSINDAAFANSGNYCIRLRDDTNTSVMTTDVLDLSNLTSLTVNFSYIVDSFEGNEDFWLQISTDNGVTFSTIEEWNLGDEFSNNSRQNETVTITEGLTSTTVLRFRCDASANNDKVYIDDVVLTGETN